jgi:hypothetical protein
MKIFCRACKNFFNAPIALIGLYLCRLLEFDAKSAAFARFGFDADLALLP